MDDKEFLALDLEGAKEYMLAYATSMKRYEQDIAAARKEAELWTSRVALAASRGMAELKAGAAAKAEELAAKIAALESERAGLAAELARLRERLPYIKARERSVDPDRLLAELRLMTGELLSDTDEAQGVETGGVGPQEPKRPADSPQMTPAPPRSEPALGGEFAKLEGATSVDAALEELKRKMRGEA